MGKPAHLLVVLACALACALAACQPSEAMDTCRKAERAGFVKNCRQYGGRKDGAREVVEANGTGEGGLARVFISTYTSDEWYEDDLRKKGHKRSACLHGNPKKRMIVTADGTGFERMCLGVYDVVDAER
jgi:hypothetical protein